MDLRKLRDRPESELAQFKKWRKRISLRHMLVLFGVSLMAISLSVIIFKLYPNLLHPKPKEQIKVYKGTVLPRQQEAEREKRATAGSTGVVTDSDSSTETLTKPMPTEDSSVETLRPPLENEIPASTTQSASDSPVSSDAEKESTDEEIREEIRKLAEEAKRIKAEMETALTQGRHTLNQAIPIIVNYLETLPPEEQKEFLKHMYRNLKSSFPPEVQTLVTENPELLEQGWEMTLDLLTEAGYTLPD